MKKGCELCGKTARMYCDSDDAILCWECDERVHSANFLVAKHSRSLLCHVCQSLTPWKASGTKLGPTLSVCESCSNHYQHAAGGGGGGEEEESESVTVEDSDDDETEIDSESDDDDDEEEEDGENQVVPWSPSTGIIRASSSSSPPPLTTSSCSEEGSPSTRDDGGDLAVSSADLKRFRHNPQLDSDDEDGCCSSKNVVMEENGGDSFRALKMARTEEFSIVETESRRRMEIMSSLVRFKQRMVCDEHNPSQIIRGISKLSREDT